MGGTATRALRRRYSVGGGAPVNFGWRIVERPKSRNLKQLALLNSDCRPTALTSTRIVWREMCILEFRTDAKICSKIMQNMKNAKKQLQTPALDRRRADK